MPQLTMMRLVHLVSALSGTSPRAASTSSKVSSMGKLGVTNMAHYLTYYCDLYSNNNNQQQSREFIELLSRSDEGAELLRRFIIPNVNKTPIGFWTPKVSTGPGGFALN